MLEVEVSCETVPLVYSIIHLLDHDLVILLILSKVRPKVREKNLTNALCLEKRNWPDFRSSSEPTKFMNSWCHGAPGIALSRLCLKRSGIWDEQIATEIEISLETTAKQDMGVDHLCCGSFGRAAILNLASDFNMGDKWDLFAQKIVELSLKRASNHNSYRLFSTQEGELLLPGAFTGMAGIGLQLLSYSSWKTKQIVAQCLTSGLLLF
jgi:lantibiotic modifying enzyme